LLFLGHFIEGNKPAFLPVGPVWIAKEIKEALGHSDRSAVSR
jgi:hypothetical protein